MTKTYNDALEWAAQWIEDTLRNGPETNERTIEFGKNMAMTLRAAKEDCASASRATAETLDKESIEAVAEPWICVEENPCEEAVPVHWEEMITALASMPASRSTETGEPPATTYKNKRVLSDEERYKWRKFYNDYTFDNCDHEHGGHPREMVCAECAFELFAHLSRAATRSEK